MVLPPKLRPVSQEFSNAALGNRLRNERIEWLSEVMQKAPAESFPTISGSPSNLERIYRALNCPAYGYAALMEAHARASIERMPKRGTCVVAHDTTEFSYSGEAEREGLGDVTGKGQGFFAHVALGLAANESRRPYGVVNMECWSRDPDREKRSSIKGRRLTGNEYARLDNKESDRWLRSVEVVEERVGGRASIVHVMDREADFYALMERLLREGRRFVIRMGKDDRRAAAARVAGAKDCLRNVLAASPVEAVREVPISARAASTIPRKRKTHPARTARTATLLMRATTAVIPRPAYLGDEYAPSIVLNLVYVQEVLPPEGEEPIDWILATSEPIDGAFDVLQVVDHYRARWTIEEYFRALKQGCAMEKRQLESLHALTNALAVFLPIASQLLLLRHLARSEPTLPATEVMTTTQLEVLRHFSSRPPGPDPTVREAMQAVAALGGHVKSKAEPGWLVLGRGYEKLLTMTEVWEVASRRGPGSRQKPDRT